jgi:CO/xanthine dehydrogenase Mo-binding subunit
VVKSVDDSAAKGIKGYRGFQQLEDPSGTLQGWVMAVAETQWSAIKSASAIRVEWAAGPTANVSDRELLAESQRLISQKDSGTLFVNDGDVDQAAQQSAQVLEATTDGAGAALPAEPVNATVEYRTIR